MNAFVLDKTKFKPCAHVWQNVYSLLDGRSEPAVTDIQLRSHGGSPFSCCITVCPFCRFVKGMEGWLNRPVPGKKDGRVIPHNPRTNMPIATHTVNEL